MKPPLLLATLLIVTAAVGGCNDATSAIHADFTGPARPIRLRVHLATPTAQDNYDAIKDEYGRPLYVQPAPLLTERDIAEAQALLGEQRNLVLLRFKAWAAGRLQAASQAAVGQRLAIFLDDRFLLSAVIVGPIESGALCLDGDFSRRRAEEIARGLLTREP